MPNPYKVVGMFAGYLFTVMTLLSVAGWLITMPNDVTVVVGYVLLVLAAFLTMWYGISTYYMFTGGKK